MPNPNTGYPYNALQDASQFPSLLVASGTAGTSDTTGTAEAIRVGGNPATGAIYVQDLSGASGTTNVQIVGGTLNAGTVTTTLALNTGTITTIVAGTQNTLGTVGVVNNLVKGTITKLEGGTLGELTNIVGGTIGTILGIGGTVNVAGAAAGTNVNIVTGTQQTLGTIGVINAGSVVITVGSVVGATASGGTPTTNPVLIAGTDVTGTVYAPLVTSGGLLNIVDVPKGTITSITNLAAGTMSAVNTIVAGTQNTLGTVGVLNAGSIVVTAGTVAAHAITNLVGGTVTAVNSIVAGTQNTLGTVGVVNAGSIVVTVGTVGGKIASGGSAVGNPVLIAGTDAGGTVYAPLVTTGGALSIVEVPKGTITNLATGTINAVTSVTNLVGGTVTSVTAVASVTNLAAGTGTAVNAIVAGTQNTLGTVGVLNAGSVVVTAGTVAAHAITNLAAGTVTAVNTIVAGTQNTLGTVGVVNNIVTGTIAAVTSVTNLVGGTVQNNDTPIQTPLSFGTLGTAGGSFFGTLSGASGAGTKHYISGLQVVVQSGTPDVRILMGTSIQGTGFLAGGAFVPSAGIVRHFDPPQVTGTNSELVYHFVSAGTALIAVNYWKGA